jgi:hypothetical protein
MSDRCMEKKGCPPIVEGGSCHVNVATFARKWGGWCSMCMCILPTPLPLRWWGCILSCHHFSLPCGPSFVVVLFPVRAGVSPSLAMPGSLVPPCSWFVTTVTYLTCPKALVNRWKHLVSIVVYFVNSLLINIYLLPLLLLLPYGLNASSHLEP